MFILYPLSFSDLGTCCLPLPESSLQELIEMLLLRGFTGGPVVKTLPSNAGGGVQSLVGELRSHMTHGEAKRLKKRKKERFLLQLFPYYLFFFFMKSNFFLTQCFPASLNTSPYLITRKSSVPLGCFKGCVPVMNPCVFLLNLSR